MSSSPVMIFYSVNSGVITIYVEIFRFLGIIPSNIPVGSMIILFLPDLDNNNIAIRDEDCCLARAGWTVCCQQTLISLSLFFITIDRHTFSKKRYKGGSWWRLEIIKREKPQPLACQDPDFPLDTFSLHKNLPGYLWVKISGF